MRERAMCSASLRWSFSCSPSPSAATRGHRSVQALRAIRGMAGFRDCVATSSGDLPWYGDSDDARGFVVSEEDIPLEVTTQLAGLLFAEPRWLRFRTTPTEAARALLPDLLGKLDQSLPASAAPRELFPEAGIACVRTHDGSVGLVMDFGPLGLGSTAAHGHADALSLWLSIDGEYFLIDAGTYAYHSHPEWRTFFRSTAAHNTVCVDGRSQSEIARPLSVEFQGECAPAAVRR